ncbi:alpha/beta hydrolase [Roseomonas sp. GC11]|uniref:alpha/beta hydrolase n=1 Tax=Roseomonas sp. GC11 TaxID=2950546 RepID=UPI002109B81C|nr:alpha/beta hydrolase [Roseomonas sp. GC11]MCQ4161399.1 alpha/beta hydrolase [Roseomonas sp. GC11]
MPDTHLPPRLPSNLPEGLNRPHLRRHAAAGSPTLLFLHGAGCGGWVWEHGFADHCAAAGYPALVLDFTRHPQGREAGLADFVAEARAALATVEGPVVAVGHSLGALVAQRLLFEPKLRAAALLAPVPPEGLWLSSTRLAFSDPRLWAEAARMDAPPGSAQPDLAPSLFGTAMPVEEARAWAARLGGESHTALLEAQAPQPVPHGWLHGRPVLVLGAGEDRLIPHDAVHRCALWHNTSAQFLPGLGHLMMLEPGWPDLASRLVAWLHKLG